MPASHRCLVSACEQPARSRCFECERFCCDLHLTTLQLETARRTLRLRVCPDCLHLYRLDPEIQPLLKGDAARVH